MSKKLCFHSKLKEAEKQLTDRERECDKLRQENVSIKEHTTDRDSNCTYLV